MNEDVRKWLEKAEHDLKVAKYNLDGGLLDVAAFHSQQATEETFIYKELKENFKAVKVIDRMAEKLPDYLRSEISSIKKLLTKLSRIRGPAFYGYKKEGIPASRAFSKEYAHDVFDRLVTLFAEFLEGFGEREE